MRKLLILGIIILVFIVAISLWWKNGTSPVSLKDKSQKVFVIPKGMAVREVGNKLKEQGLIRDPVVFFLFIKKNGLDQNVQAGSYKLSPSMDLTQIMYTIRHGTIDIWVTFPEGLRSEEIAQILKEEIPTYQDGWVNSLKEEEGYLFPDTYLIPKDADINTVISILKNNFYSKIESIGLSKDNPKLRNILIMASLIEREAITDEEKPLIASVMYNRLNDGIGLDIDATLQYAKGKVGNKWWTVPTSYDRQIDSPYNTYKYQGLPPGPISNPGIEAIKAAYEPASSSYYYYIHDTHGKIHFARTISEHNANVEKYLN